MKNNLPNRMLAQLLAQAAVYLDHPDVTKIPFALPSSAMAARLRDASEALQEPRSTTTKRRIGYDR